MTALDLQGIASAGGNLIVNGSKYSASHLKSIAAAGLKTKSTLVIKNASKLSGLDCKSIASANPGCVTFDFSEQQ
ncbi:hypothetical protein [Porphyromonas gingivalis]|uniref:hypothetical protein n=1 Tax=Porphyromonas gingivalis TaxID=837 RepID=UPI0003AD75B9|nr:hypothetical protein [Porphyromonas gingivalis]ATR92334.1 hypothetical protein CS545_04055 [Porphyromonas gingivalis]ATS07670.1 hypothetical protein CS388_00525 [Porphyromonas gingivalis]ERJ70742.1 hypothetical protein HMPREF1553_00056 [Porphyromonas gingivalis F0568]MCE8187298.1 hypothetical protein [Porphyromonas gingivalis]